MLMNAVASTKSVSSGRGVVRERCGPYCATLALVSIVLPPPSHSDAVLVNYGPPEAARPGLASGAEILELVACVKELVLSTKEVLKAHVHDDASFSGMSQNWLLRLLQARRLLQG